MIRCVVFDLGEVLSSPASLYAEGAALLGVDPAAYEAAYWAGRVQYDQGASDTQYWTPILTSLGRPATPERVRAIAELDARQWVDGVHPDALALLHDVRAAGRLVGVLTNAPFSVDLALADAPYADDADYWFVSASMGVAKPDPAVYYRVQEVVDLEPHEIAFIDDRPENVYGARQAGWEAHLFVDDAGTRSWLRSLEVLGQ